tara:strand:- start:32 stop:409 length:378 start_codon:yes stop_codon:yes gene_type:complete
MPQIELSTTKGLVQKSGQGFVDAGFQEHSAGSVDLTAATVTASEKGALVHILSANGANVFKLFTKDDGAVKGQIKVIILKAEAADGNSFVIDNHDNTDLVTLAEEGDMAICVFNGTNWVSGKALA